MRLRLRKKGGLRWAWVVRRAWVIGWRWGRGGVGLVMVKVLNGAAPSVGTGRTAASTRAAAPRLVI